jgi:nucleotide-binding universal stress UspA family protein
MWKKILVPLDGSDLAELALPYAEELANAFKSEVILLHVSDPADTHYRHMHELYVKEVADRVKERFKKVSPVVVTGKPADEIISYAEKNDIGLLIITSHGHSGIMSWATGSIASKLLQATAVPLLLVRAARPKRKRKVLRETLLNRILLPLDGSEAGEAAVAYIGELMSRLESEVILFGVVSSGQHIRTVGGLDYIHYPQEQLEIFRKEAGEYLDGVYRRLKRRKGTVKVTVKVGADDIGQEILKYAEKERASLIAISSHGHSGIEKWVFGSIANKVVQGSKLPVLVVKALGEKV